MGARVVGEGKIGRGKVLREVAAQAHAAEAEGEQAVGAHARLAADEAERERWPFALEQRELVAATNRRLRPSHMWVGV